MTDRDPIDLLVQHHARVREQIDVLAGIESRLQDHDSASLELAAREAGAVIDVLGHLGHLHALDEGETLFPRLRLVGSLPREVTVSLDRAERDHHTVSPVWPVLQRLLWQLTVPDGTLSIRDFREARLSLKEHYLPHLELEEQIVFPAARRLIAPGAFLEMVDEMTRRRREPHGVDLVAVP